MWTVTASPLGELRIVARERHVTGIWFEDATIPAGTPLGDRDDAHPLLVEAARQLAAYFAGELEGFDLPLQPDGTEFQRSVWAELLRIPYGETTTYGEIAARLGRTGNGARAVGTANGSNPIPIVIPCHRVVGADGSLTGYSGGAWRKQLLLEVEQDALF